MTGPRPRLPALLSPGPLPYERGYSGPMPRRGSPMDVYFQQAALNQMGAPFWEALGIQTPQLPAGLMQPVAEPTQMPGIDVVGQAPAAPMPAPQPEQGLLAPNEAGPGFLQRLFGGGVLPPLAGMDKGELGRTHGGAGQDALLAAASSLIESGSTPYGQAAPSTAQAIMRGLMSGRETYRESLQRGRQGVAQERMEEVLQRIGMSPESFNTAAPQLVAEALRGGDTRTALAMLQYMSSQEQPQDKWRLGGGEDTGYFLYNETRPDDIRPVTGGIGAAQGLPRRAQEMAFKLSQQFETEAGANLRTIRDASRGVLSALDAMDRNPAEAGPERMRAIYGLIRALDPRSVVREGEVELFNRAQSLWSEMQQYIARAGSGEMPVAIRQSLRRAMDDVLRLARESEGLERANITGRYRALTGRDAREMAEVLGNPLVGGGSSGGGGGSQTRKTTTSGSYGEY